MSESDISTIDDVAVTKSVKKAKVEVLKGTNSDDSMSGKYEMLTVYSSNDEGGGNAVPVGINGYLYQIPRDKPFKVPTEVVAVLRDAFTTTFSRNKDGEMVSADRPRYAFSAIPA
jgi:hypothetical protein